MTLLFSPSHNSWLVAIARVLLANLYLSIEQVTDDGSAWGIIAAVALVAFLFCVFYAVLSRKG